MYLISHILQDLNLKGSNLQSLNFSQFVELMSLNIHLLHKSNLFLPVDDNTLNLYEIQRQIHYWGSEI